MEAKSSRQQVRYERSDINAVIKKTPVFLNPFQPVKIINVSKQGVAICSNQSLKINNHLRITFCFDQGESFFLNGQVVHAFNKQGNFQEAEFVELFPGDLISAIPLCFKYGIFFEQNYPQFRGYLIESGCRNGFEIQQRGFYQRQTRF